jgi:hypothetical protein
MVTGILESQVFSTPAKMPAVVSKRGVLMGTIKVGAFSSRRKKATNIITPFSIFLRRAEAGFPLASAFR